MMNRRLLLRTLFSLGGLAVLIAACKHRAPYGQKQEQEKEEGMGGSY